MSAIKVKVLSAMARRTDGQWFCVAIAENNKRCDIFSSVNLVDKFADNVIVVNSTQKGKDDGSITIICSDKTKVYINGNFYISILYAALVNQK
jgi:hypothetical protein